MALNIAGTTISPLDVASYQDVIKEVVFNNLTLTQLHRVETGIKSKEQILFSSQLGKLGLKSAGNCTIAESGATVDFTEKFWDLATIEDRMAICSKTLDKSFKPNLADINRWIDRYDFTGSQQEAFIIMHVAESITQMIWRAVWFADAGAAVAGAGTSGLVAAGDVKFYDYFDGIWAQLFDGVTAGDIKRVTITENAVVTSKANQLALAAGASDAYFGKVRMAASQSLRASKDAVMMVSGELFYNQEEYLISKGIVYDINISQNGLPTLKYRGHELINMETIWNSDEKGGGTREDFVNNTADAVYDKPHRIVFCTKNNIPVGALSADDFSTFESWFEQKDKKNYIDFGLEIESKVIQEKDIVVAF